MKKLLLLTAAIIGGIALPAAVFAGPTENITGCATIAAEGSNYTIRADVTCALGAKPTTGNLFGVSIDDDNDPTTPDVAGISFPEFGPVLIGG